MKIQFYSRYPDVSSLRSRAKSRIPRFAFNYLDGGCNDEINLQTNINDLQKVCLKPVYLKKRKEVDLSTTLWLHQYNAPFGIAPVGLQGLIWPGATEALAKAAYVHNIPFILSTVATASIETVGEITEGNAWFQLYYPAEKTVTDDILRRLESSGYEILVLLTDVPSFGYRPKEIRDGLAMPPRMSFRNMMQIASRPMWALSTLQHGQPTFKTLKTYMGGKMDLHHLGLFMNKTFDGKMTEEKIKYIRDKWKGKVLLKGITSEFDAEKAIEWGMDGIIVSNHGGRQLDAGESAIASLQRVKKILQNKLPVMMDSGLRSGPDIVRAIASGADCTFLGRAFMYGVAALGERGASHTISLLIKQVRQVMDQINCPDIKQIPHHLIK
jgi:L-lactate dehydrogenase (cytochrome)